MEDGSALKWDRNSSARILVSPQALALPALGNFHDSTKCKHESARGRLPLIRARINLLQRRGRKIMQRKQRQR